MRIDTGEADSPAHGRPLEGDSAEFEEARCSAAEPLGLEPVAREPFLGRRGRHGHFGLEWSRASEIYLREVVGSIGAVLWGCWRILYCMLRARMWGIGKINPYLI